jgi:hypothetical protein
MTEEEKRGDPHAHRTWHGPRPFRILPSALDAVGDTPMIRLNRIPSSEGVEAEIVAKCEFFNAGAYPNGPSILPADPPRHPPPRPAHPVLIWAAPSLLHGCTARLYHRNIVRSQTV